MPSSVVVNQPGVYLVDADGNIVTGDDGTTISSHEGLLIAGKDGTVLRFLRVAADGTLRIDPTGTTTQPVSAASLPLPTGAATETKLEAVRALLATIDADTSSIAGEDFATETTLEAVRVLLLSIDGKDFATETTLASLEAKDFATETTVSGIETTLNALEDRGQELMVDSLPVVVASDQSDLDVVLKDSAGDEWAVHEGDQVSGLQTPGPLIHGATVTGEVQPGHMIVDPDEDHVHRLQTEARIAPGSRVSIVPIGISEEDLGNLFRQFLTDDGLPTGSDDMIVDGSSTAVEFTLPAHPTLNYVLTEIRFTMTCLQYTWGGDQFGKGGGALPNGMKIEMTANAGTVVDFGTLTVNEELLMLPVRNSVVLAQAGNRDLVALSIDLGGLAILEAGSSDEIKVTIQDDMTNGTRAINYLKFAAYGVRVLPD